MALQNPGREDLQSLQRGVNRVFEQGTGESAARNWAPAVDVLENEHEIVLEAELPGLSRDAIDIQFSGETLTLRGERPVPASASGEQTHRMERLYGPFSRSFQIEVPINAVEIKANYDAGVLTIVLPKHEAIKPRQINIQVG